MPLYRLKTLLDEWRWSRQIRREMRAGSFEAKYLGALSRLDGGARSVLVVCTGNICRSPYGAERLKAMLQKAGKTGVTIASAGTDTTPGKNADPTAHSAAAIRGIDLTSHRTSSVTVELLGRFDLILVMDTPHLDAIAKIDEQAANRSMLLGAILLPASPTPIISDPFGLPPARFQACFEQIDSALMKLVEQGLFF